MSSDLRNVPKKFGATVRGLRVAAGLTQMKLAEAEDLTHNFVGEVERGEKLVSLETLVRLGRGLGLSGADLLKKSGL